MGDVTNEENRGLPQLHWQEKAVLVPIIIAILLIGIQPAPFFSTMDATVNKLVSDVQGHIPQKDNVAYAAGSERAGPEPGSLGGLHAA